jgi:hypothetical protein
MAQAQRPLASIDVCDRHHQLLDRIRRARECQQCGETRTVILDGRSVYKHSHGFCAPCLSDLLCVLVNKTHRRIR